MANGVMRTCKGGGCTMCNASEENVGKRRCNHILDNASIEVRREKGINFIDISGNVDNEKTSFSMKASQTKIKSFISSLSNGLSKEDQESILSVLREG